MSIFQSPRRAARVLALSAALASTGCVSIHLPGARIEPLVETVVAGREGPKILLVEIDGEITDAPRTVGFLGTTRECMVARVREELDRAREDDEIRALLLRINSPGGSVTASDLLYREIQRFKEERQLPVIAQLMGIATSGGYYVALAADRIRAHPTTVTGSIGVIFVSINVAGLMEKIGIEDQTLVSGKFKASGSLLHRMSADERAQLQAVLDDLHRRFVKTVEAGRPALSAEQARDLADGRIFSASSALDHGLVDAVGFLDEAVEEAEQRAGIDRSRVVTYHRPQEYQNNLYTRSMQPNAPNLRILPGWADSRGPAFLYLWAPGAGE